LHHPAADQDCQRANEATDGDAEQFAAHGDILSYVAAAPTVRDCGAIAGPSNIDAPCPSG
jgi:hypothetical protein